MRNKPGPSKPCLNVSRCHTDLKGGQKRGKEVLLINIGGARPDLLLNLTTVRSFQRGKTTNIERLEDMRRVCRYIEGDDIGILAVQLEIGGVVTFVPVKD